MSAGNKSADEVVNDALLEKLRTYAAKPQEAADALRAIAAKIHARVTSSDRRIRERTLEKLWRKNSGAMESFIMTLENCKDHVANYSVTGILHECISPRVTKGKSKERGSKNKSATRTSSRMAVIQLINLGITQVLVKLLINLQHADTITGEVLTQDILWILGQVAQRDQKFVSKMKLLNSVKVFHALLKQHYNNSKTLLPLLLIIKTLAKNSFSLQTLVKDGITNTLEKTFVNIGYTPHLKLRTLLDCFKHLTTNRLCCSKFVKAGMVHLLMRIFERWERFDGQIRLKICNYALNTLQHLCIIKAGRKAIKANNGLQLLYRFCTSCPEDKAYDCLLSRICGIINQCLEKKELPVPEMSPARFVLPEANVNRANSAESGSDVDSQANSVASIGRLYSDLDSGDDEESHDSRDTMDNEIHVGDEVDESKFFAGVFTSQRSEEDLAGYHTFFKELGNLRSQLHIVGSSNVKLTDLCLVEDDQINAPLTKVGKTKTLVKDFSRSNGTPKSQLVNGTHSLKVLEDVSANATERHAYCAVASKARSVISFVKVAYPDLIGGDGMGKAEPLNIKDRKVCRAKLLACVERGLHAAATIQEVVYDLDALASPALRAASGDERLFGNWDEKRVGKRNFDTKRLQFESRFESGNLRKAIQIGPREYDLILTPDVNSGSRHQWFYFEVSSMEANAPYTFNIINCEKTNSQFNFGMKPILFSVIEAQCGRPGWVRTGVDICYYRNCYQRTTRGKTYFTTSFTVTFPHAYDVCYLAYHFPYTYSRLMTNIWKWTKTVSAANVYFRAETLCETLNGNENPVLTITSPDSKTNPIHTRKMIFLTSRVHPGESNASWVMHGTMEALLSDNQHASSLRDDYVFKIIPMLNIEGVVNGCNRYGLTNEDLNRRWSSPNRTYHPVIYHTKGLMEYCARVLQRPPHVFVDYHGHSRRKNVFLFGCSRSGSWSAADRAKPDQPVQYLMLPHLMQRTSPAFALQLCSFKVERNKESTARVAVWRQLGVSRSYTMESSFCGCDQGVLAGLHFDTEHLKAIGRDFCQALSMMKDGGDDWAIGKSTEQACCPRMCVLRMSRKIPKCIQDKHAIHHTTALS
ncbi:PREDICTED: cytosolic carboxypeptidase 1-like isoform X4 [Vollenhovia emeryi]|nr:PREDICTED: cytosolic carboxypeptidase 1-like isoform X4 [Vollenhovia emeryi]XP_011867872.1 PREDICTED: cytosolic carboxypeptidase 1-like isoform X4 [Vollenhovia emeryi]XP_011867875.1 PREDICTED: cytosolic carboxypeptidase 1-like isoform X4 [Vollenhovia emeryi]